MIDERYARQILKYKPTGREDFGRHLLYYEYFIASFA
jgi:hypothetical protein